MADERNIPVRTFYSQYGKAVFDRILGIVLAVLALPVVVVLLVLSAAFFGWPPLRRLPRVGRRGRHFGLYRISTARGSGSDLRGRRLRYSAFIRRTSLDELPQIWNVALGHISLVGPRPLDPTIAGELSTAIRQRNAARPGLTGPWQVEARGDGRHLVEHVDLDLAYLREMSFGRDLSLLVRTVPALLRHRETV